MVAVVPQLGASGWVTSPMKTLDLLISHALESDKSQSTIFNDEVFSIPWYIATYQDNESLLIQNIDNGLSKYLSRYFDSVNVDTTTTAPDSQGRYELNLAASVKRDGVTYDIAKLALIRDGKILRVVAENNK